MLNHGKWRSNQTNSNWFLAGEILFAVAGHGWLPGWCEPYQGHAEAGNARNENPFFRNGKTEKPFSLSLLLLLFYMKRNKQLHCSWENRSNLDGKQAILSCSAWNMVPFHTMKWQGNVASPIMKRKKHSMNTCSHTVTIFSMINFCLTQYGTWLSTWVTMSLWIYWVTLWQHLDFLQFIRPWSPAPAGISMNPWQRLVPKWVAGICTIRGW